VVQNQFLEIPVIPHDTEFDDGYDVKLWVRNVVPNNWKLENKSANQVQVGRVCSPFMFPRPLRSAVI